MIGRTQAFIPGKRFPSLSITGSSCWLNCDFCRGRYLRGMEYAMGQRKFVKVVRNLIERGAKGILISGGFRRDGTLPIEPYLPLIKRIKEDYDIIISVHPGLVNRDIAEKLYEAGVDIVDYEFIVDPVVIRDIMHLNKSPEDFIKSYEILIDYGPMYIAPHIPIGFRYGTIAEEYNAIDILIKNYDPYIMIFLVFMPTKGTPMEDLKPPSVNDVVSVIRYARSRYSGLISLGCMRPWSIKFKLDPIIIEFSLVDRVVNPLRQIIRQYKLDIIEACCSIPKDFEYIFRMNLLSRK